MKVICKKDYGILYLKGKKYRIIETITMPSSKRYPIPCKWHLIHGEYDCKFNFAVEKMKEINYFHEHFITIAKIRKLKLEEIERRII